MKKLNYITVTLVSILVSMTSCTQMEDVHKNFIEGGEIVYRAKPDSIMGYPGKNRAKLIWKLKYPTLVVKCEIRDGNKILAELPVAYQDSIQFEYILQNLEEKTHTFSLYSLDAAGNSSIKSDVVVEVYGERYSNTLKTERNIVEVLRKSDNKHKALVSLSDNVFLKVIGTDISYYNTAGTKKHITLLGSATNKIWIDDVAENSSFEIADLWLPMPNSIDTFPAPRKIYEFEKIPQPSARILTSITKSDATTVNITLSRAAANTTHTIIAFDGKEINVKPGDTNVVLKEVSPTAILTVTTYIIDSEEIQYRTSPIYYETKDLVPV